MSSLNSHFSIFLSAEFKELHIDIPLSLSLCPWKLVLIITFLESRLSLGLDARPAQHTYPVCVGICLLNTISKSRHCHLESVDIILRSLLSRLQELLRFEQLLFCQVGRTTGDRECDYYTWRTTGKENLSIETTSRLH